jgi:hypothetical protein
MHEHAERLAGSLVTADLALEREFEARLADSSRLAFRVAYSVLRQREDAEDVAQEAFAKAYRSFSQLRDRTRFRAWPTGPMPGPVQYRDIGTNIDCSARTLDDGAFQLRLNVEDTSVYTNAQDGATPSVGQMPVFRTFRSTNTLVLRDGQTREFTAAADRVNGEVIRIAVTLKTVK